MVPGALKSDIESAAMRIIVNADDFGSSGDTTQAIIECFEAGLVTSASIMVGAPETERAIEFACSHPEYSYGAHLQFVGDGTERPLSPPELVPALVDADGRLLSTNNIRLRALLRKIPIAQIEREIVAQVEFLRGHGVAVSHVDSHRHVHKFPPFRRALGNVLPGLQIESVRNVQDVHLRRPVEHPTYWSGPAWRRAMMTSFATTDHFYMPTTAHDPNWHELAGRLPGDGETLEVGMHPGYADDWRRAELESLAPFVDAVRREGHLLVGWDEI